MKIRSMIRNTMLLLAAVCVSFVMSSCEGDEGPMGPQGAAGASGAAGPQGATGPEGAAGLNGQSALTKSGKFEGTIAGTRKDGTEFSETFSYEYMESFYEAFREDQDYTWIYRYAESSYNSPYIEMRLQLIDRDQETETIAADQLYLNFIKEIDATTLFRFYLNTNDVEVSNYVYNPATGSLSFDFSFTGFSNSTENEAIIEGSFTTGEGKLYRNVVNRKGN